MGLVWVCILRLGAVSPGRSRVYRFFHFCLFWLGFLIFVGFGVYIPRNK
jgi:hypothetical protein